MHSYLGVLDPDLVPLHHGVFELLRRSSEDVCPTDLGDSEPHISSPLTLELLSRIMVSTGTGDNLPQLEF